MTTRPPDASAKTTGLPPNADPSSSRKHSGGGGYSSGYNNGYQHINPIGVLQYTDTQARKVTRDAG